MCDKYLDNISLYIDDMLDEKEVEELKNHLKNCDECNQIYENMLFIKNSLSDIDDIDTPENLHANIMNNIDTVKNKTTQNTKKGKIIPINFGKQLVFVASIAAFLMVFTPSITNVYHNFINPQTFIMADDFTLDERIDYFKENGLVSNKLSISITTDDIEKSANEIYSQLENYSNKSIYCNDEVSVISVAMNKYDVPILIKYLEDTFEDSIYSSSTKQLTTSIVNTEKEIENRTNRTFNWPEFSFDNILNLYSKDVEVSITIKS